MLHYKINHCILKFEIALFEDLNISKKMPLNLNRINNVISAIKDLIPVNLVFLSRFYAC